MDQPRFSYELSRMGEGGRHREFWHQTGKTARAHRRIDQCHAAILRRESVVLAPDRSRCNAREAKSLPRATGAGRGGRRERGGGTAYESTKIQRRRRTNAVLTFDIPSIAHATLRGGLPYFLSRHPYPPRTALLPSYVGFQSSPPPSMYV